MGRKSSQSKHLLSIRVLISVYSDSSKVHRSNNMHCYAVMLLICEFAAFENICIISFNKYSGKKEN